MTATRATIAIASVVAAVAAAGSASAATPAYVTEVGLTAAFQENGVSVGGRNRTVLEAACLGAGFHRGTFPYERYHIFECYISTAARPDMTYRVTTAKSRGGYDYSYRLVSG